MSSVASSLLGFITMAQPRKCKERLKTLAVGHEWVTNQHLIVYLKERWMTMQTMHWWLVILRTTCNQRQSLESIMWSSFIELRSHKMLSKSSRGNNDHVWSFWLRHVGPWKGLCANEWNQKRQSCSVKNTCKNCCFLDPLSITLLWRKEENLASRDFNASLLHFKSNAIKVQCATL